MRRLKGWQTIRDICDVLELNYETVRQQVVLAHDDKEPWVKMNPSPRRWQINTDHPGFHDQFGAFLDECEHEEEADELVSSEEPLNNIPMSFCDDLSSSDLGEHCILHLPVATRLSLAIPFEGSCFDGSSLAHVWEALCTWLHEEGVLVFSNALAHDEDTPWQWQWGALQGYGYATMEDAVLSAVRTKVTRLNEPLTVQHRKRWFQAH